VVEELESHPESQTKPAAFATYVIVWIWEDLMGVSNMMVLLHLALIGKVAFFDTLLTPMQSCLHKFTRGRGKGLDVCSGPLKNLQSLINANCQCRLHPLVIL